MSLWAHSSGEKRFLSILCAVLSVHWLVSWHMSHGLKGIQAPANFALRFNVASGFFSAYLWQLRHWHYIHPFCLTSASMYFGDLNLHLSLINYGHRNDKDDMRRALLFIWVSKGGCFTHFAGWVAGSPQVLIPEWTTVAHTILRNDLGYVFVGMTRCKESFERKWSAFEPQPYNLVAIQTWTFFICKIRLLPKF